MERWPNFFIVGVPRAGTTSLHNYLKAMPGIFMSPIKEPNFFDDTTISNDHRQNPMRPKEKYLELFKDAKDEKILGESSIFYLPDPDVPKKIHKIIPNAKILISLRDPANRVFSHYLLHVKHQRASISFHDWMMDEIKNGTDLNNFPDIGIRRGLYSSDIVRFVDVFGKENVKVLLFEEWTLNIKDTINEILKFLDLDYQIIKFDDTTYNRIMMKKNHNATKGKIVRRKYSNSITVPEANTINKKNVNMSKLYKVVLSTISDNVIKIFAAKAINKRMNGNIIK